MELNLDGLKDAKVADYIKAFKDKVLWKTKTNFSILLSGYKLGGKKTPIALPYKKEQEAKENFKRIRKEKKHPINKVAIGSIIYEEAANTFVFTINGGGANAEKIQAAYTPLFAKIKIGFKVLMGAIDPEMAVAASEMVSEDTDNEPDDVLEDIAFDWTDMDKAGAALFTEAQTYQQSPDDTKTGALQQKITAFLADYKEALKEAETVAPPQMLVERHTKLQAFLQKLETKIKHTRMKALRQELHKINNLLHS